MIKQKSSALILIFPLYLIGLFLSTTVQSQKTYKISSVNNDLNLTVTTSDELSWSVTKNGRTIIEKATISMNIGKNILGKNLVLNKSKTRLVNEILTPVIALKNKNIVNEYNELELQFKGDFIIQFRVFNEGVAYRFITKCPKKLTIIDEQLDIELGKNTTSMFPQEESLNSHFERSYIPIKLDTITPEHFASLPVFFERNDFKIVVTEADQYDYPGLFLKGNGEGGISSLFPKKIKNIVPLDGYEDRIAVIKETEDFIAITDGKRSFPWRVFAIAVEAKDLLTNEMVYKLSRPLEIEDTSWIKPGKVSWDWYNKNNIYHVDFVAGINTNTYKYYIDFAAEYNLEYVILDEGWSKTTTNILEFNPDMDVQEIIDYGKKKGVGIILWCLWKPLVEDLEYILGTYAQWGAAGIKVDFMQRADQDMVNHYTKMAKVAAQHKLLVDFHGAFKPNGLRRAYPNVLTYEGVRGSENHKWSSDITPTHNVLIPYIRMMAGPMDYTPGAMRNAHLKNHAKNFDRPMSIGTRAHQAAMYVIYESPLQMLCDSPTAYLLDKNTIEVISQVPTTWDKTLAINGEVGEFVTMARQKDSTWYLGSMTNETPRKFQIPLDFLNKEKSYQAILIKDGINADKHAEDYEVAQQQLKANDHLILELAAGGGYLAIIKPTN